MVNKNVCKYNKFGFCKFGNICFRKHENRICENERCEIQECLLRHPRKCRFFLEYSYCKFGTYCKFKHETFVAQETVKEINYLKTKLDALTLDILEKEEEINMKKKELR